jgi:hypothetical protein
MLLGLISVTAIAFLLWLLFALAVNALPVFAAVGAGLLAHATGAGVPVSILVGIIIGGLMIGVGQALFARVHSPITRALLGLLFSAPAAVATFFAARGILRLSVDSEVWLLGFSVIASVAGGFIAWHKLAMGAHLAETPTADLGQRKGPAEPSPQSLMVRSGPAPWPPRPRRR